MSIDLNAFNKASAISAIPFQWQTYILDLVKRVNGKSPMETISIIIARKNYMPETEQVTEQQRQILIQSFLDILPHEEHESYLRILYWVGWDNTYKTYI